MARVRQGARATGSSQASADAAPATRTPADEARATQDPTADGSEDEARTAAAGWTRPTEPGPHSDLVDTLRNVLAAYQPVTVAYLFGSQARTSASPISDVDVAVIVDPALARDRLTPR